MNILITGAGGFIGQALAAALLLNPSISTLTLTDVADPQIPAKNVKSATEIRSVKADLTDRATCETLFTSQLTHVYLLQ